MTSINSNPFDFSDFGGRAPSGSVDPALPAAPQFNSGGFDPFAGEATAPRDTPGTDQVFTAAAAGQGDTLAVAGPPLTVAAAALAAALVGTVLGAAAAATDSMVELAFAGWLLAGPAAIGVLAWFNSLDTRRRINSVYAAPTWLSTAYWVVVAVCAAGIAVGAWQIALWAGRQ